MMKSYYVIKASDLDKRLAEIVFGIKEKWKETRSRTNLNYQDFVSQILGMSYDEYSNDYSAYLSKQKLLKDTLSHNKNIEITALPKNFVTGTNYFLERSVNSIYDKIADNISGLKLVQKYGGVYFDKGILPQLNIDNFLPENLKAIMKKSCQQKNWWCN